jgi:hypothetical protein
MFVFQRGNDKLILNDTCKQEEKYASAMLKTDEYDADISHNSRVWVATYDQQAALKLMEQHAKYFSPLHKSYIISIAEPELIGNYLQHGGVNPLHRDNAWVWYWRLYEATRQLDDLDEFMNSF